MTATAFRIAVRDARAARGKFLFVVVAVALGVGSLTGVRGFSQAFASMLLREARSIMAADISIRIFGDTSAEQESILAGLSTRNVQVTRVTETVSMVSSKAEPRPCAGHVKSRRSTGLPVLRTTGADASWQVERTANRRNRGPVGRRADPAQSRGERNH